MQAKSKVRIGRWPDGNHPSRGGDQRVLESVGKLFLCPACTKATPTVVINNQKGDPYLRTRECKVCGHRYKTEERGSDCPVALRLRWSDEAGWR